MMYSHYFPAGFALACSLCSLGNYAQAAEMEGFLEEVIVTAEKRETSLQDTAIAVSAFSNQELERGLINNNMDVQMAVPNMLMSRDFYTSANISIRGIGNLAVGTSADAGTGVHFNGVYVNNSRIFETEYFDTERVEILRGPQGTLYGRNTTGGVINILTARPATEPGGDISLSYGDYDHFKVKGALNIPVTNALSQRFSVFYLQRDGYVDNLYDGNDIDDRDMYALRSSTRWQAGESTDVTLVINYFDEDSTRMRGAASYCASDANGILGCLPNRGKPYQNSNTAGTVGGFLTSATGLITGETFPVDDNANRVNTGDPRKLNLDFTPQYEADETIVTLEINHQFDDFTLSSVSGYQDSYLDARNDYDFGVASEPWPYPVTTPRGPDGPITTEYLYQNDRSTTEPEQWSQEFRLASDFEGDWNFLAGTFYLNYESETHYYVYSSALAAYGDAFGVPENQWLFDNDTSNYELETWALFGELYYDINERTELTVGIRYTDETKEADNRSIYLDFLDDPASEGGGYIPLEDDWQETTGKININYHWKEELMLYATIARSYKSGGFNPISPESPLLDPDLGGDPGLASFEPEYINSFEMGAKTRWLSNTLQANVTYFYYDYEDLQVSKITNNTSINENMDADIQGFEGEFVWAPNEHWTVMSNLAWLDTELGDFETFDPADPNQMGTTDGVFSLGNSNLYLPCGCPGLDVDVEGNQLPNAPEYSAWLTLRYGWSLENGMRMDLFSSYYWQDEFYTRIFNTEDDKLEDWNVWNASVMLTGASQNWYAEAWIRNIEDEEILTGQHLQDAAVGLFRTYQLLEPRTYGLTLGYSRRRP